MRRSDIDAALQGLYDQIPDIPGCKGLCWVSCGPIGMSQRERQRIREAGFRITDHHDARVMHEEYWCEALGPDGYCQVYPLRPLICRLWGAVEGLPCPYGCVPEGGFLSDDEGRRLLAEAMAAGGGELGMDPVALRRVARDPVIQEVLTELRERGIAGDRGRIERHGRELPEVVRRRKPRKSRQ